MSDPWRVVFAPAAARELRALPPRLSAALSVRIAGLADDPMPPDARKVVGTPYWRIRLGELRALYAVDASARNVVVVRVARRAESTYRRLR